MKILWALRRAWCRWFGCVPASASRVEWRGNEIVWGVTVHCWRCWRRYSPDEQQRAMQVGAALDGMLR